MFLIFCLARFQEFLETEYKYQSLPMSECFQTFFSTHDNIRKIWKCSTMGDDEKLFLIFVLSGLFFKWNPRNITVQKK